MMLITYRDLRSCSKTFRRSVPLGVVRHGVVDPAQCPSTRRRHFARGRKTTQRGVIDRRVLDVFLDSEVQLFMTRKMYSRKGFWTVVLYLRQLH